MTTRQPGGGEESSGLPGRQGTPALQQHLRARLLAWDPIGVADRPGTADEYDCLIDPLMRRLRDGASAEAIASWLCGELDDHVGLDPETEREAALAAELTAWWAGATLP